jgi:hypothetical protein
MSIVVRFHPKSLTAAQYDGTDPCPASMTGVFA